MLNTAVRVEFMARQVPSQAGNETSEDFETLFVSFPCINSCHTMLCDRNACGNASSSILMPQVCLFGSQPHMRHQPIFIKILIGLCCEMTLYLLVFTPWSRPGARGMHRLAHGGTEGARGYSDGPLGRR